MGWVKIFGILASLLQMVMTRIERKDHEHTGEVKTANKFMREALDDVKKAQAARRAVAAADPAKLHEDDGYRRDD